MLQDAGLTVAGEATDAGSAVTLAAASEPEGILIDIGLPDRRRTTTGEGTRRVAMAPASAVDIERPGRGETPDGRNVGGIGFVPKEDLPDVPLQAHAGDLARGMDVSLLATSAAGEYGEDVSVPVRVVVGEDDVLMREGIVRLLVDAGFDVVAQTGNADDFLRKALAHRPDVAVVDIRMPPGEADGGLRAALELRHRHPDIGVVVLSQYYEQEYALDLIGNSAEGVGYLLKERVGDVEMFTDAVSRVAAGGSALDPEVIGRMLGRRPSNDALDQLSPRDRDVLALVAEGKSNQGIAETLVISTAAVEKHITNIFYKLGLQPEPTAHRRVRAALTYLNRSRR